MIVLTQFLKRFTFTAMVGGSLLSLAQAPDKSGVKPSVISLPSGPGAIEGLGESFEPQLNTGTSTYSVNIELPPGRAGLQPKLSLSYNSGLGNSIVGIGWDLALPVIKRQTDKGFPSYTPSDTFLFQGEELVPLSDGTYRCENETGFQRFRPLNPSSDDYEGWLMTERNGTQHYFGRFVGRDGKWSRIVKSEGPREELEGRSEQDLTYCWALDRTVDLHGNRIEYEYDRRKGKLYPNRITYSHFENAYHEVELRYERRPDQFEDYRPTFSVEIDRRLSSVHVRTNGEPVRSYELQYEYELTDEQDDHATMSSTEKEARLRQVDLGLSQLKRVTQWDRTGMHFLPPLIFHYSFMDSEAAGKVRAIVGADGFPELDLGEESGRTQMADVNGDGLPDLFSTEEFTGAQWVSLNLGASDDGVLRFAEKVLVSNASAIRLENPETNLSDIDGDGVVDVVNITRGTLTSELRLRRNLNRLESNDQLLGFDGSNGGSALIQNAPVWLSFSNPLMRQMDLDFDKVSDFLLMDVSGFGGLEFTSFRSNGLGDWTVSKGTPSQIPSTYRFDLGQSPDDDVRVQLADMNGDRLLDFVVMERQETGAGAALLVKYWPYCAVSRWAGDASGRPIKPAVGDGFVVANAALRDFLLQDFTGDGLADILYLDGASNQSKATLRVNVAGRGWAAPTVYENLPAYQPHGIGAVTTFRTADLNGNGSTDLIWRNRGLGDNSWLWLDLMPKAGKPNLLIRIDNSIGKLTEIVYGNAHQDYLRAREKGFPWRTKIPFSIQVVRQIRTHCGFDLNGDQLEDVYVSEFQYRDGYYDGLEKEFRGFAFAQRIDYGDDYVWNPKKQQIEESQKWERGRTPTRQVSGPTLVSRYRFHTGTADQIDNDEGDLIRDGGAYVDEYTLLGGREEECLKGKQLMEEKLDPWLLRQGDATDFDANCAVAAEEGLYANLSPDPFVFTRARQRWGVRRLYRPENAIGLWADQDRDGQTEFYESRPWIPSGRFSETSANQAFGRSVSFAFVKTIETDVIEANPLFAAELGYPERAKKQTLKAFEYDDYGNLTEEFDHGILGEDYDDERVVRTTYALGGEALSRWIISQPDAINTTDEAGDFVNRTRHYYDGSSFEGLDSGSIGARGLLHRVERSIIESARVQEKRTSYDDYGNLIQIRDPNFGTQGGVEGGNLRRISYDSLLGLYPVAESIAIGGGSKDLEVRADYDLGFGVVTNSFDFNGNRTLFEFDSFARLVAVVKPGDSRQLPTEMYCYQAADQRRGRVFRYARSGSLSQTIEAGAANRVVTFNREQAGTDQVYTTAVYTDGCGKTLVELGEDEISGSWIVSKASSYNLRSTEAATWLPYQVRSVVVPRFQSIWPNGRPPIEDDYTDTVVSIDHFYDSVGRKVAILQAAEFFGGQRENTWTQFLPFEKRNFDENDSDRLSKHWNTPLVHFEDGLGRLVKVHEVVRLTNDGAAGPINSWETRYTYDLNDKIASITDNQNNLKSFEYDGLERLVSLNDPNRGVMKNVYDDASNLIQTTDAKGQVTRYTYDGANRLLTEDYLDEAEPFSAKHEYDPGVVLSENNRPDVAYFYDHSFEGLDLGDGSTGTGENSSGQLCYVWDLAGEEHFSYDVRGRLDWRVKRILDSLLQGVLVSYQTKFTYDSFDRMVALHYPDSDRVGYTYNARNLLESVDGQAKGSIVAKSSYQPSNQLVSRTLGNGADASFEFDPRLRLRAIEVVGRSSLPFIDLRYSFDAACNITRIDDLRDLPGDFVGHLRRNTQDYSYDDQYRLARVAYPSPKVLQDYEISYRYDSIGNMVQKKSNIPDVDSEGFSLTDLGEMAYGGSAGARDRQGASPGIPGPHALTRVAADGGRSYSYDRNGNMVAIDGVECIWDFKNRMIGTKKGRMEARYVYDYLDRRIVKVVRPKGGGRDVTIYVDKYFEIRPQDSVLKYVWIGDTRIARVLKRLISTGGDQTQRVRIREGWNLKAFGNDGGLIRKLSHANLPAMYHWDYERESWVPLAGETAGQSSIVWIHAHQDLVLSFLLSQTRPSLNHWDSSGGGFLSNPFSFPVSINDGNLDVNWWFWDDEHQQWAVRSDDTSASLLGSSLKVLEANDVVYTGDVGVGVKIEREVVDEPEWVFYHQDHLGSTCVTTDEDGNLVEETANYPFGYQRYRHVAQGVAGYYGYGQKEKDLESGLSYFDARYLSTSLGRFNRVDPISGGVPSNAMLRNPNWMGPYSFSANNPVTMVDTSGEEPVSVVLLTMAGGAVTAGAADAAGQIAGQIITAYIAGDVEGLMNHKFTIDASSIVLSSAIGAFTAGSLSGGAFSKAFVKEVGQDLLMSIGKETSLALLERGLKTMVSEKMISAKNAGRIMTVTKTAFNALELRDVFKGKDGFTGLNSKMISGELGQARGAFEGLKLSGALNKTLLDFAGNTLGNDKLKGGASFGVGRISTDLNGGRGAACVIGMPSTSDSAR